MKIETLPKLLSAPETADRLGVSVRTVWQLAATGQLRRRKVGRRTVFHPRDIAAFIERCGEGRSTR